jgi:hypothetical protein
MLSLLDPYPFKVESIKETMALYFYHDLHKRLSLNLINFGIVLERAIA